MMRTTTYNQVTLEPDKVLTKAWAWRISRRLELCAGWFHGPLPTLCYVQPRGLLHPGAVSRTLRIWRAMVGWRWYLKRHIDSGL